MVDVAVPGVDVVEELPAAPQQWTQSSRRGLLTVCPATPSFDVSWRGVEEHQGSSGSRPDPDADPEPLVARVGEQRDGELDGDGQDGDERERPPEPPSPGATIAARSRSSRPADARGTGWAWAGSQRHIQAYTNTPRLVPLLDDELRAALPVLAGRELEWRSPVAGERYEEPRDERFWTAIDQPTLGRAASGWWPRRGPSWDAVALARDGSEPATAVLVEAKANVPEFTAGALAATAVASITMIRAALESARVALNASGPLGAWTGAHYQLANRLAWTYWLREQGIQAVFAYVLFHDDRSHIPTARDELIAEARAGFAALGLPDAAEWYAILALPAVL